MFLIPGWFAYNELANLTQSADLVSGHSHGGSGTIPKYWVDGTVVYTLLLVPLVIAALWTAFRIATRFRFRLPNAAGVSVRASVIAVLLGGVPALAWLLHQAANRAASSQVYYTSALLFVHVHSHAFFAAGHKAPLPAGPPVTAAPFAFAYQVARAFQDGLVGLAIGLPVAALVLLWGTRRLHLRDQDRFQQEGSHHEEVANR